jgi:O-antigen/teichoic acid export membrane protein
MQAVLFGTSLLILLTTQLLKGNRRMVLLIVSFALLPNGFNALASACIRAYQRMEISSGINMSLRLLTTIAGIVSLRRGGDETHVLMIYLGVSAIGSVVFFSILRHWNLKLLFRHAWQIWRLVLRESFPFAVSKLSAALYMRMDMLMLALWKGDRVAGIYGTSYRLWELMGVVPASFLDALFPEMSRLAGNDEKKRNFLSFYSRSRGIIMLALAGLVVCSWLLAPFLIRQLFQNPENVGLSVAIFRILILLLPLTSFYLLNGHLLYAAGKQHQVMKALLAAVLINIAGNALLIPTWSYWGAVAATWLSESFLCIRLGRAARHSIQ